MTNEIQQFESVPAYTAGNLPQQAAEQGLIQAQNQYFTAMKVQVPRDLAKIRNEMLTEAKMAKEKFYYSLPWGARVEGPSIGMAKSLARTFGNCLLDMKVETSSDSWLFKAYFIDLEKGYCVSKLFSQPRKINLGKNFDKKENIARRENIAFQIGQSKALRNVIVLAMPEWLIEETFETAKEAALEDSSGKKGEKSKQNAIKYFGQRGISIEQLEVFLGNRKSDTWVATDIAKLRELVQSVKENVVALADVFPPAKISEQTMTVPKTPEIPAKVETPEIPVENTPKQASLVPEEPTGSPTENQKEQEAEWRLQELELEYPDLSKRFIRALQGKPASVIVKEIEKSAKQQEQKYAKDKAPSRKNGKEKISF